MPIDIEALRAAHAAGASADVLMALIEVQHVPDKKTEARRARDREYQRVRRRTTSADVGRNRTTSADVGTTSADTPADPPPAAGPPQNRPLDVESVDKNSTVSEEGLTKHDDSSLSSLLPSFDESSNSKERKAVDTHAREAADSLFEKFWKAYPNKVGKRDAANSFRRIIKSGIVGIDDLMAGLARYVAKTDDRPWCNPATWLNGGRWDDQPSLFNGGANGQHQNGSNGSSHGVGAQGVGFSGYALRLARKIAEERR